MTKTFDSIEAAGKWAQAVERRIEQDGASDLAQSAMSAVVALSFPYQSRLKKFVSTVLELAGEIGPMPGVYLLLDGEEVVYVGESCNAARRLAEHSTSNKRFTHVRMIEASRDLDRRRIEQFLIVELRPKYNVAHNRKAA